jgi:hypothetical protein
MFASAQLLRNWREQRPSNQGDLGLSVTGEVRENYTGADLLLIYFLLPWYAIVIGWVLNDTFFISRRLSIFWR